LPPRGFQCVARGRVRGMNNRVQKKDHVWAPADNQWYVEPERCTRQLLAVERFNGAVYDPCCGQGNIVKNLRRGGYAAFGSDIVERKGQGRWFLGTMDYLAGDAPPKVFPNIVMNPPFYKSKGTEAFIRRAIAHTPGKVAAFVN